MWNYFAVGFCLLYLSKYNESWPCQCDTRNEADGEDIVINKRGLKAEEAVTEEAVTKVVNTELDVLETTTYEPNETIIDLPIPVNNDSNVHLLSESMQIPEGLSRHYEKVCSKYIKDIYFELKKMADVWKILYYQMPERLRCFKMLLRLLTEKDQQMYAERYGNFNNTINWRKCVIEVSSNMRPSSSRRHFLQNDETGTGIMENLIIDEEQYKNRTFVVLSREAADQWFVIKNIMVMKDCDTGLIAIFTRVPFEPRREDIKDVLTAFGDDDANGGLACEGQMTAASWLRN